mmetsp:Transcript_24369/g.52800  ORF Transcript_24369/g.52800 Transcript_24369/m.52800 type:complete len:295 (+) Transcript_24369:2499-3383(+)
MARTYGWHLMVHAAADGGGEDVNVAAGKSGTSASNADADLLLLGIDAHALDELATDAIALVLATFLGKDPLEVVLLLVAAEVVGHGLDALDLSLLLGGPLLGAEVLPLPALLVEGQDLELIVGEGIARLLLDFGDLIPGAGGADSGLGVLPLLPFIGNGEGTVAAAGRLLGLLGGAGGVGRSAGRTRTGSPRLLLLLLRMRGKGSIHGIGRVSLGRRGTSRRALRKSMRRRRRMIVAPGRTGIARHCARRDGVAGRRLRLLIRALGIIIIAAALSLLGAVHLDLALPQWRPGLV